MFGKIVVADGSPDSSLPQAKSLSLLWRQVGGFYLIQSRVYVRLQVGLLQLFQSA